MLPGHLKRYVVDQDYSRYTPIDQEVWRYIMHQLRDFLTENAHPCYLEGLAKTGIEMDRIPDIRLMSEKLRQFGWNAIPVSGFIPPAAFMELQSLGYLPIASDMRTIDHLMYTPAPDIVHEAAGHAPILIDEEYAAYLKSYAQVASKAIIGRQDMDQYEAIRILSDLKEDPNSTPEQIAQAETNLTTVTHQLSHLSEAAYLGRMNWWTAEYGLIGTLENPKIFGAGLLSSVAEARACLKPKVKKLPLTLECVNYAYDITEQQPQLFVTPDFQHLTAVLEELAKQMAYRVGGVEGLDKAKKAQTVNTVELNSGLQISGRLKEFHTRASQAIYLQFEGPAQMSQAGVELDGHGTDYHAQGFGSPVGCFDGNEICPSEMSDTDLAALGIHTGAQADLHFKSGVRVQGRVQSLTRAQSGRLILISFSEARAGLGDTVLFDPAWGTYDMAVGSQVVSVFGGPADRPRFGETEDFVAPVIPRKQWPPLLQHKHRLYNQLRELRRDLQGAQSPTAEAAVARFEAIVQTLQVDFPHDWLLRLSLFELSRKLSVPTWTERLEKELRTLAIENPEIDGQISDGLRLAN